ncbi:hypothetical protein GWR56_13790 [Mucilaginibacter sp. 14171R-50]|uniref:sensor histidine kinase n=1 Tax=Mucilaginibacter sp. 14171R-50 TaxID=2703789 RepID=UPI00138CE33F|nr:histidine kinase [Mucilaginibacter sp. 14171R-50]QHS56561.1 hypothetical protein GWR56_13790 [Mucilaginibacter sp. 14171R-50]
MVNICVFYSALYLLNGTFERKERSFANVLLFLLLFLFFTLTKVALAIMLDPAPPSTFRQVLTSVGNLIAINTFRSIYFCALALLYWVAGNIASYRKKAAESEKKQLIALKDKAELEHRLSESRNAYLQQQLNPHLLFNSLSFIYSSVYAHSEDASRCVLLLSDIMRYSLDSTSADGKIPLADELQQIGNLVELNRYRFHQNLYLHTAIEVGTDDLRIIPLVLLTLTENLFKHGHLTDRSSPALLEIDVNASGQLRYHARNRKAVKSSVPRRGGLGLRNTRTRLEHTYGDHYKLEVKEDQDFFELTLTIPL